MNNNPHDDGQVSGNLALDTKREIDRFNARMRHFHGVASSVIADAEKLLAELWEACQDPRTPEEIIDGVEIPAGSVPAGGWGEFKEKLYLLGHYLDYTQRLLDGSIEEDDHSEREV